MERILREEGGVTGGWDERDHERFLRYRTQHPGQPRVYISKTAGPPRMQRERERERERKIDRERERKIDRER